MKAIADVVANHRVGTTGWSDFTNPNWTTYTIVNNDECNCGLGAGDTGDGFSAARDLAHTNVGEVQNGILITGSTRQLAMKIGPNSWSPGSGWTLQTSGTNYAVWMK